MSTAAVALIPMREPATEVKVSGVARASDGAVQLESLLAAGSRSAWEWNSASVSEWVSHLGSD